MTVFHETEVKLYMPDLDAIAHRLAALGADLTAPRVFERNVRYEDTASSLSDRGIVLRLRQDARAWLTYKEPLPALLQEAAVSHRFEAEVEVSDFAAMEMILTRLGFHPFMVYEKYRTTYTLDEAEIVLDEMPYGNFIEVEGTSAAIDDILRRLGLQDAPRLLTNYLRLFRHIRDRLNLPFTDLTFDHFAGITVPASLFDVTDLGDLP